MKRNIIFIIGIILMASQNANALCVSAGKSYTACKPGYYLTETTELISQTTLGTCISCPESGTSADENSDDITSCYLPSGTTGSDITGSYEYTNDCYYGG